MDNTTLLSIILSWLGFTWAIYRLFNIASETVKQESKLILSNWLSNIQLERHKNWYFPVNDLFNGFFGKRHFSWKCFLRSAIVSYLLFLYFYIVLAPILETEENFVLTDLFYNPGILVIPLFLNILPDYLSLLETRWIIGKLEKSDSFLWWSIMLLLDIVLTIAIFFIVSGICYAIYFTVRNPIFHIDVFREDFITWTSTIYNTIIGNIMGGSDITLILFLTTFFTSFWVWIYVATGLIVKMTNIPLSTYNFFQTHFDIKNKPFKVLGVSAILIVTLIYLMVIIKLLLY